MNPRAVTFGLMSVFVALLFVYNWAFLAFVSTSIGMEQAWPYYTAMRSWVLSPGVQLLNATLMAAALGWVVRTRHDPRSYNARVIVFGMALGNIGGVLLLLMH